MLQRSGAARFLLETAQAGGILRGCGDDLHGHATAELRVEGGEDATHAPLSQLALDPVAAGEHVSGPEPLEGVEDLGTGRWRGDARRTGWCFGADESAPGEVVEPGDQRRDRQPEHAQPDERAER